MKIVHGTAIYTGGGFYTVIGETDNGLWFYGDVDWCAVIDVDPRTKAKDHDPDGVYDDDELALFYDFDWICEHVVETNIREKYKMYEDFCKRLDNGERKIDKGYEKYTNMGRDVCECINFSYFDELKQDGYYDEMYKKLEIQEEKYENEDIMYVATMGTEHYSWTALGKTEKEAKEAILRTWNKRQIKIELYNLYDSVEQLDDYYGIRVMELKPGECEVI